MKLIIRLDHISLEHYRYLTKLGYTIVLTGWGEIVHGTVKLSV